MERHIVRLSCAVSLTTSGYAELCGHGATARDTAAAHVAARLVARPARARAAGRSEDRVLAIGLALLGVAMARRRPAVVVGEPAGGHGGVCGLVALLCGRSCPGQVLILVLILIDIEHAHVHSGSAGSDRSAASAAASAAARSSGSSSATRAGDAATATAAIADAIAHRYARRLSGILILNARNEHVKLR